MIRSRVDVLTQKSLAELEAAIAVRRALPPRWKRRARREAMRRYAAHIAAWRIYMLRAERTPR